MNNMEHLRSTSHTAGAQSAYLESLYESYLEDSSSIPEDWKIYFDSLPQVNGSNEKFLIKKLSTDLKKTKLILQFKIFQGKLNQMLIKLKYFK